jgi:hypothetical protein
MVPKILEKDGDLKRKGPFSNWGLNLWGDATVILSITTMTYCGLGRAAEYDLHHRFLVIRNWESQGIELCPTTIGMII